ncbi:MAG: peptidoglycan-binding domain-containing protein, partial [Gemmatimonadota bacterium]
MKLRIWTGIETVSLLLVGALLPGDLSSQVVVRGGEAATIRVVETYDPVSGTTTSSALEPLAARDVLSLQRALARAGMPPGPPDGRLGPRTRAALEAFQRARGLEPCGCLSYETLLALGFEPRVVEIVVGAGGERSGPGVEILRP